MRASTILPLMRVTVEIPDQMLREVLQITGETQKSPAIAKAVAEFVKRSRARTLGKLIREGAFDYEGTNEDLEAEQDR